MTLHLILIFFALAFLLPPSRPWNAFHATLGLSLNPEPFTLNPKPYTLYPKP